MLSFKEMLIESADMAKLNLILSNIQSASTLTPEQIKKINKKDLDKFNKCLQGMLGCSSKIKEIADKVNQ